MACGTLARARDTMANSYMDDAALPRVRRKRTSGMNRQRLFCNIEAAALGKAKIVELPEALVRQIFSFASADY